MGKLVLFSSLCWSGFNEFHTLPLTVWRKAAPPKALQESCPLLFCGLRTVRKVQLLLKSQPYKCLVTSPTTFHWLCLLPALSPCLSSLPDPKHFTVFSAGVRIHLSNLFCVRLCCQSESRSVTSDSLRLHRLYSPWNSPGQNTGVGSLSLHQRIFPTQGSNPGLPPCRPVLYRLSHQGSHTGVGSLSLFSGSSWPRIRTGVSCIAGGFFTNWAIREALIQALL